MCPPQAKAINVINLKPETSQKVQKISNRFWLAGILFSITNAVLKVSFRHALQCPHGINSLLWEKTGRLTKETREIRGLDEKNIGEDNARKSRLRALQT
jgi:peroxin-11B